MKDWKRIISYTGNRNIASNRAPFEASVHNSCHLQRTAKGGKRSKSRTHFAADWRLNLTSILSVSSVPIMQCSYRLQQHMHGDDGLHSSFSMQGNEYRYCKHWWPFLLHSKGQEKQRFYKSALVFFSQQPKRMKFLYNVQKKKSGERLPLFSNIHISALAEVTWASDWTASTICS